MIPEGNIAVLMTLAMIGDQRCVFCGRGWPKPQDIRDREPICASKTEKGLGYACKPCWDSKRYGTNGMIEVPYGNEVRCFTSEDGKWVYQGTRAIP